MKLTRQRIVVVSVLLGPGLVLAKAPRKRPYRLPDVDIKQRVIWGATCDGGGGGAVAFGGQDQQSEDGRPHTRIRLDGRWRAIHEQLRTANPLQKLHDRLRPSGPAAATSLIGIPSGLLQPNRAPSP